MQGVDLPSYNFTTLFVDPPRMGLDDATVALARRFPNILYISCNPQTLRDNVAALAATHEIRAAAVFDQFPYTTTWNAASAEPPPGRPDGRRASRRPASPVHHEAACGATTAGRG
jgi:hypothetical protein